MNCECGNERGAFNLKEYLRTWTEASGGLGGKAAGMRHDNKKIYFKVV